MLDSAHGHDPLRPRPRGRVDADEQVGLESRDREVLGFGGRVEPVLAGQLPGHPPRDAVAEQAHLHGGHRLVPGQRLPFGQLAAADRAVEQVERLRAQQLRRDQLVRGRHRNPLADEVNERRCVDSEAGHAVAP